MTTTITKTHYATVAAQINRLLEQFHGTGLEPSVSVLERGEDGLLILLNDDAYDLAERPSFVQDMFHAGEVYVVGDDDFYLEPFDSNMTFKLAI